MKSLRKSFQTLFLIVLALGVFTCAAGESLSLPSALQSIEEEAFANCESLEGIMILPLDVQVDDSAFSGVDNLDIIRGVAVVGDDDTPWNGTLSGDVWSAVSPFCEARGISCTYTTNADSAINAGYNVVITVGFGASEAVNTLQSSHPDVRFICLDASVDNQQSNVYAATYRCDLAGFMAGYTAVKQGYRSLGYMGGIEVSDVVNYGQGFVRGANQAAVEGGIADQVSVAYTYTGVFWPDNSVYEKAGAWYRDGVEIIFCAGGNQGTSVNAAASENNGKMIGVDTDQRSDLSTVLFCAVKNLGFTATDALAQILDNNWKNLGGNAPQLGLVSSAPGNNHVGLVPAGQWDSAVISKLMNGTYPSGNIQINVYNDMTEEPPIRHVAVVGSEATPSSGTMDLVVKQKVADFCQSNEISFTYTDSVEEALSQECDVVITVGFGFSEDVANVQWDYPDTRFICLDTTIDYQNDNVYSVTYKCDQAGFMAGYAAVRMGYRSLGFMGGIPVYEVTKYGNGFVQGANQAAVEMGIANQVTIAYTYMNTFAPDASVYEQAASWYDNGTEIIFCCGGGMGEAVSSVATEKGKKMIGVDTDQSNLGSCVVTSAVKNVGFSAVNALSRMMNGEWDEIRGTGYRVGVISATPADNHVCLSTSTQFNNGFTASDYASMVSKLHSKTYPSGSIQIAVTGGFTEPESVEIGISFPTDEIIRWANDGEALAEALTDAEHTVSLQYASNNAFTQADQIDDLINQGCQVLVVAPVNSSPLEDVLTQAKAKGITIISYDRLLMGTDAVDYYLTFSNYAIGVTQASYIINALGLDNSSETFYLEITGGDPRDQNGSIFYHGAMDTLQPYIDSGRLAIRSGQIALADVCTAEWNPEAANTRAKSLLNTYYANGERLDAWLCLNDSTAQGVIPALISDYKGTTWPIITGQDCDIANVKYIIQGKQAMSIFKDTHTLATSTATMVLQILNSQTVTVNDTTSYHNGNKTVSTFLCDPCYVDIDNYEEILIGGGFYSAEDFQ